MDDRLQELINEIKSLKEEMVELKKTTGRMDGHIDFVEGVFSIIRIPLMTLMNTVNEILPSAELPELGD
jgi:hypothetical protein